MAEDAELSDEMNRMLEEGNTVFEEMCASRHQMGAEHYGEHTWMGNNTVEMMLEEIVDLANYARYTFIKAYILGTKLGDYQRKIVSTGVLDDDPDVAISDVHSEENI